MGVVSRGGSFHCAMMMQRDEENPLYAEYDYLLEILAEYDVTVSLGDGMRPGCLQDAEKLAKSVEYITLGTLAKQAQAKGVQRMIEGPGHMPLDQVGLQCEDDQGDHRPCPALPSRTACHRYRAGLRPRCRGHRRRQLRASTVPISSAWSRRVSTLPCRMLQDIIEGTPGGKDRCACRGPPSGNTRAGGWTREVQMAEARHELDWDEQFRLSLYGDHARKIHERDGETETCSMCGDFVCGQDGE